MKILTVIGARPQFVKASAVSRQIEALRESGMPITELIVHTGQHYDDRMSQIFFRELNIPQPFCNLDVGGMGHAEMTADMLKKLSPVVEDVNPDLVLIYGDTNSTLVGALAASKLHIPICHVEAGLRSHNMRMPEEVNRIVADRLSSQLFCPTDLAYQNLIVEGVEHWGGRPEAHVVGDVMLDCMMHYHNFREPIADLSVESDIILATVHRAENTDMRSRLENFISALATLAEDHMVVLPLHPRTKKLAAKENISFGNIIVIEPVGYLNMLWLIDAAKLVVTDSGGLQKEAFFYSVPCVTVRDETEWGELIDGGYNRLAPPEDKGLILAAASEAIKTNFERSAIFGNGHAAKDIITEISRKFG